MTDSKDDRVERLRQRLLSDPGHAVPDSSIARAGRAAFAAARTGAGMLAGALRGEGGPGIARADLETIEKLVTSLGHLKGVPMKMGQILGTIDERIPPEARRLLSLLQTQSQPAAPEVIAGVLRRELGAKAEELLATLDLVPVSVASIGQVHRARLPDGTSVAVKVQHPGIEKAVNADFRSAGAGKAFARMFPGGGATVRECISEARERLLEECDYKLEAERQRTFHGLYARHDVLVIPAVHRRWSSRRVLTTTWEDGLDLESYLESGAHLAARSRAGEALFELFLGTLYRHALFHADPHPGNYRFRADGRIVVFDFGCVRVFDAPTVSALAALARAVRADDAGAIQDALEALGARHTRGDADFALVRLLLRGFFGPMLRPGPRAVDPGEGLELTSIVRDKLALMRLELPGKLLFLFRIRFGLYAALARLGSVCDWSKLEASYADEA
ncbi:MAG: AarF/ABC1/UbiB kinase family protein [Thermoanaerobaculia bacterium]